MHGSTDSVIRLKSGCGYVVVVGDMKMLDGNDIWEALFSIFKSNVPDEMTEEKCSELAEWLGATLSTKDADHE